MGGRVNFHHVMAIKNLAAPACYASTPPPNTVDLALPGRWHLHLHVASILRSRSEVGGAAEHSPRNLGKYNYDTM